MKTIRMIALLLISFTLNMTHSETTHDLCEGFLPENDMEIPVGRVGIGIERAGGLTEQQYNSVLDKVYNVYASKVAQHGGQLVIEKAWSDGNVNAYAERRGNQFVVKMLGGLARHNVMTEDGLALVACHEIGHHIGGVPRYAGRWASTEGQSDYFANLKCMRFVFSGDDNEAIVKQLNPSRFVVDKCEEQFGNRDDQLLCMRSAMAGMVGSSLFASLSGGSAPRFETPDPNVVAQTYESHPHYQCRLDTYFQASLCSVSENTPIGQNNANEGTCNRANNDEVGLRSLCWYKPTSGGGGGGGNPGGVANTPTVNGQTQIVSTNPNMQIPISINVSNFPGAVGVAFEISKPNATFSNPNGTQPDPQNGLGLKVMSGTSGIFTILPARQLPGWGTYQMRVIPLDKNRQPVGKNSDSFTLVLRPQ